MIFERICVQLFGMQLVEALIVHEKLYKLLSYT